MYYCGNMTFSPWHRGHNGITRQLNFAHLGSAIYYFSLYSVACECSKINRNLKHILLKTKWETNVLILPFVKRRFPMTHMDVNGKEIKIDFPEQAILFEIVVSSNLIIQIQTQVFDMLNTRCWSKFQGVWMFINNNWTPKYN